MGVCVCVDVEYLTTCLASVFLIIYACLLWILSKQIGVHTHTRVIAGVLWRLSGVSRRRRSRARVCMPTLGEACTKQHLFMFNHDKDRFALWLKELREEERDINKAVWESYEEKGLPGGQ